jgi:hypothetical protein
MAKNITKSDLVQLLASTNAEEITVKQFGECKMKKTDNPFFHKEGRSWVPDHKVEKESLTTYDFGGASYEERVNEALVADGSTGTFKGGSLSWGEFVKGAEGRVIEYNGEYYVRCYVKNDLKPQVRYFVDDADATADQIKIIKEFTADKTGSAKQANEGLAEDKQVIPNNIPFSKIVTIEVDGTEYAIA